MWICAKCGTEAQQLETCSGCGSAMKPFGQPAKPNTLFILQMGNSDEGYEQFVGPFITVMEADQWWDQHCREERFAHIRFHEVTVMETPT